MEKSGRVDHGYNHSQTLKVPQNITKDMPPFLFGTIKGEEEAELLSSPSPLMDMPPWLAGAIATHQGERERESS